MLFLQVRASHQWRVIRQRRLSAHFSVISSALNNLVGSSLCRLLVLGWQGVAVGVARDDNATVAQPLAHHDERDPGVGPEAGVGVPQTADGDAWLEGLLEVCHTRGWSAPHLRPRTPSRSPPLPLAAPRSGGLGGSARAAKVIEYLKPPWHRYAACTGQDVTDWVSRSSVPDYSGQKRLYETCDVLRQRRSSAVQAPCGWPKSPAQLPANAPRGLLHPHPLVEYAPDEQAEPPLRER
jgi:hypothetical protein